MWKFDCRVGCVAFLMLSVPSFGVSADQPAASSTALEEVVVTAQRRAESVQDVPASLSAVTGNVIRELRIDSPAQLVSAVSGVNVSVPYGEGTPAVFTVRGVTANDFSPAQARPVALYLDESIRTGGVFESLPLFDIERVEVLKGPQGALYGRNATGGAVNVISTSPGFDTGGYFSAGVGNLSRREAQGAVQTAVLADRLAVRAAFTYAHDDGAIKDVSGFPNPDQTDVFAARLSFLMKPRDDLDVLLRLNYARNSGAGYGILDRDLNPAFTGGVDRSGLSFNEQQSNRRSSKDLRNHGANLQLTWRASEHVELKSITAFDRGSWKTIGDDDGLPISYLEADTFVDGARALSQEFRVRSDLPGKLNWQAGVSYAEDKLDFRQKLYWWNEPSLGVQDPFGFGTPCCGINLSNYFSQKRKGAAAYLRLDFENTSTVSTFVSGRFSHDRVEVWNYGSSFGETVPGEAPGFENQLIPNYASKDSFHKATFEAGVRWKVRQAALAYATFRQGYRAGAINLQALFDVSEINVVPPEEVNSYEIGFKSEPLGGRAILNAAAFYLTYKNQQFLNADPVTGLQTLKSAEKSTIKGLEGEFRWEANDRIGLNANVTWIDPKYKKATLNGASIDGSQLIGASEWTAVVGVDWIVAPLAEGKIKFHADSSYQSETYFDAFNDPTARQGALMLTNANLGYERGRYHFWLWGKNITDEKYITYALNVQGLFGYTQTLRGRPRTFGASIGVDF